MGQLFAFTPGFTGIRCNSSDYGAVGFNTTARVSLLFPLFKFFPNHFARHCVLLSPLGSVSTAKPATTGGLYHDD